MALLMTALRNASPGPTAQDLQGLAIGRYEAIGGVAYLSGRRLSCSPLPPEAPFTSSCSIEIAGRTLQIEARRNPPGDPNQLGGACVAQYDGRAWPCRVGSRHVHVHWFAAVNDPLGLDASQLENLRRQYPLENLPQGDFLPAVLLAAVLTALVGLAGTAALLWPKVRPVWLLAVVSLASSFVVFFAAGLLGIRLTMGFWD